MRRSPACAAPRCRCRTPSTWRRRRSPRCRRSWPRSGRCWTPMAEFLMPILTADMSAGTLVEWRKKPGDALKRGDIIALVETDKGLIDIEVFTPGVLEQIVVVPGATVPTGAVLAIIREEAATGMPASAVAGPPAVPPPTPSPGPPAPPP